MKGFVSSGRDLNHGTRRHFAIIDQLYNKEMLTIIMVIETITEHSVRDLDNVNQTMPVANNGNMNKESKKHR